MDTSFKNFLSELGRLIHDRSIISCVYPKLVALEAVNELTKLNSSLPGLISTSKEAVLNHLKENPYPAVVFVTEHLFDGSGLELILRWLLYTPHLGNMGQGHLKRPSQGNLERFCQGH